MELETPGYSLQNRKWTSTSNPDTNALSCTRTDNSVLRKCNEVLDHQYGEIHLNGLYDVCIEKDHELVVTEADEIQLKKKVRALLHDHRNLCEDFVEINILRPTPFGICAEVELEQGVKAEEAYVDIIKALKNFMQPELRYYTLQELLDKGKTIEEIFAGRPYRKESFGFVDTQELEQIELRHAFHLSDLYSVILAIEGVRKVKKVRIGECSSREQAEGKDWIGTTKIPPGSVPVFSLEETCVDLYSNGRILRLDKTKIRRTLGFVKKFELPLAELNTEVPYGKYLDGLEDFHSIQNDFPVVYGIGEDGLPENAGLLRKTQALQLKGYLMFYDQLLANYAAQLAHIRALFSLRPEQERTLEQKQTYFTGIPSGVPNGEKLMGFYNQDSGRIKDSLLAVPVFNDAEWKAALNALQNNPRKKLSIGNYCEGSKGLAHMAIFNSSSLRTIYINQLIDSFFNEAYGVDTIKDYDGHFFVLCPNLPNDILFVSSKRYPSADEAIKQAKSVAFLASLKESYHLVSDLSDPNSADQHYFDLTYQPTTYLQSIQNLTETKESYINRRKQFLDHLLARFGEEFTDYTLFQYQNKIKNPGRNEETLNDQSNYVNEFADISRNRGKAFNYLKPSWNTDNVSGFEKRVSLLSGINDYGRRNLCNFEVTECYRLQLKDPRGNVLFRSNRSYETKTELYEAAKKVLLNLRHPRSYERLEKNLNGFDAQKLGRVFSIQPREENIIVSKYEFHQQLFDASKKEVDLGRISKMKSEKAALAREGEFIEYINETFSRKSTDEGYRLLPLDQPHRYLNAKALHYTINTLISWKWHSAIDPKKKAKSKKTFQDEEEAWNNLVKEIAPTNYLIRHKTAFKWKLTIKGNIGFEGSHFYADKNKAVTAWRQTKTLAHSPKNFTLEKEAETVRLNLRNEKGKSIARSNEIALQELDVEELVADCVRVFGNRSTKPRYESQSDKFGFRIHRKNGTPLLNSYCIYESEKEALKELGKAFQHGKTVQNYLKSGDEGNPEYNFILKDKQDAFLAVPPQDFETASDRDKTLKSTSQFFKSNQVPFYVKEEPRRYSWTLFEDGEKALSAKAEFSSKGKALANFDKEISKEASRGSHKFFELLIYEFKIKPVAVAFNFVYGRSNPQNELEPIFKSRDSFKTAKQASESYTEFAKKLPGLAFKSGSKKGVPYDFALLEEGKKVPIAIQYRMGRQKASPEAAEELIDYITAIYTKSGAPRERFITAEMVEDQEAKYEWRFYKKNAPLAKSPYLCPSREVAQRLKSIICDVVPPISLRECPPKKKVVCPEKNPNKYHYQVCFKTNNGREFRLISYCGFDTYEAAMAAWKKEWLVVIDLAREPEQYLDGGKIGINENYKDEDSKACGQSEPIAIIPEVVKRRLEEEGEPVIDYHVRLANLFPIYKVEDEDDGECNDKYRYRVTVSDENFLNIDCGLDYKGSYQGSLLWVSVACYQNIGEAIAAYQHFYTLAGTSNNCRILCEKGQFCVGLVEVFAESACKYDSESEAWDEAFPEKRNLCDTCVPGGVREFLYAAEEDRNYIPICDQQWWKFKVVATSYFVVDHSCCYNSEKERDEQMKVWMERFQKLDWTKHDPKQIFAVKKGKTEIDLMTAFSSSESFLENLGILCELVMVVRECLKECPKREGKDGDTDLEKRYRSAVIRCLKEKLKDVLKDRPKLYQAICKVLAHPAFEIKPLDRLANYFPVYKTEEGYCYRLYWEPNDPTGGGLQPCDCDDSDKESEDPCKEAFPFISSNCYDCCEEALKAFVEFAKLIREGSFDIERVTKSEYGPYSFQIIDTSKELAYHPQQYDCMQDVLDAIEITKACVNNTGMHLLEHILLRPKKEEECGRLIMVGDNEFIRSDDCLLPICPDYCCPIRWQPDLEKDDPCAESDTDSGLIYYLPGADPYSFWATLVLPAWAKRFRTQEARQTFEEFLYREVPALVGLNILWLSPKDMCKFESAYRKWLDWMQDRNREQCPPNDGPPHCVLVDCIKELESELPCPSAPGEQGDCDCDCSEPNEIDPCCLPPETKGTIFWGHCPPPTTPEGNLTHEVGISIEPSAAAAVVSKKTAAKDKARPSAKKKASKKKEPSKKVEKKATEKQLQALVRRRKPQYLSNIETLADEPMKQTKSYERALFFIKNVPTMKAYSQLVDFFNRYSLQKGNNIIGFLGLIKNATWHLFDTLVLDKKADLKKENITSLKQSLAELKAKGLSLTELKKDWQHGEIEKLANENVLNQLLRLLK